MLLLKSSLLLLYVGFVLGQGPDGKSVDNDINAVTSTDVERTKTQATVSASTTKPITEAPTTTQDPVTTQKTSTIISTTISPTTVSPNSSTPEPTPPTTTVAPKPEQWEVVGEHGIVCILARMTIKMDLKLPGHSKGITYTVPKEAEANGTCGENLQTLTLSWDKNQLTLFFKDNETLAKYYLDSVAVELTESNITVKLNGKDITMFETALNHAYVCAYSDPFKFSQNNETVQVSFSNIKLEAFKQNNSTSFSNIYACPPDTPDIVPIVVGCALTVLVVVVLIAYLVSRRRTQARGYLSM